MHSKSRFILFLILTAVIYLNASKSEARTFKNAYISFEMQDNWACKLEQTEWVCRSEDPQEAKKAIIILTAKEKGPTDTFQIYESHMNGAIETKTKAGSSMISKIVYKANQVKYNDQTWLDGLHQSSEVQNYYTRYLATIKDEIAILVTLSAHNKEYANFSADFDKTVRSLRVIATKDLLSRPDLGPIAGSGETLGSGISQAMPADLLASDELAEEAAANKGLLQNEVFLGALLFAIAAIIYIGLRIYKKRNA